jgi:hypothetical protein
LRAARPNHLSPQSSFKKKELNPQSCFKKKNSAPKALDPMSVPHKRRGRTSPVAVPVASNFEMEGVDLLNIFAL